MKLKSWDGNAINDGTNYNAAWGGFAPHGLPAVGANQINRTGLWPVLGAISRPGRTLNFTVYVRSGGSSAELASWFDPEDETAKQLVVEDAGGGNDRYVMAICEQLEEVPFRAGRAYQVSIRIHGDVRWREVTGSTDSWSITASGQTKVITNNGKDDAYPVLTITPTSAKADGFLYARWVPIRWRTNAGYVKYPVDITNDSLDTAALIAGGKMQADGDDLRVYADNVEVYRWLDGINTTTTKVWVNLSFQPKQEVLLKTAIAGSGDITAIDSQDDISGFPSSGILMIGTEAFTYVGKSNSLKRFFRVTRAAKGTAIAAHSAGDTVWWVQHDVWIYYGNSSLSAPKIDDDQKPMFSLSTSTNTSWDYTEFRESDGLRSASWTGAGPGTYGGSRGAAADPWEEIGIKSTVPSYGARWSLYNPCRITNGNFQSGESYLESLAETVGGKIESSKDGRTWTEEYSIPEPVSAQNWTAWSRNEAMTAGISHISLVMDYLSLGANRVFLECSQVTVTLDSSYTPTLSISSEQNSYQLSAIITNTTTGDAIGISAVIVADESVEINTDEKTVIYLLDNSNLFPALTISGAPRKNWLKLAPGANTLQYDETNVNGVTIDFDWEERHYQ